MVESEDIDPAKLGARLDVLRGELVPAFKKIDGFAGFISLFDAENRRGRAILLWETREGAKEAERQSAATREELVRAWAESSAPPISTR